MLWPTVGVIGLGLGVATAMLEAPVLGLAAGFLAFAAGSGSLFERDVDVETPSPEADVELTDREPGPTVITPSQTSAAHGDLLSAEYFEVAVRSRVTAARRFLKPVAVVRLRLASYDAPNPARHPEVAEIVGSTLRECDTACVLDDTNIALVLEDTPETGAIWVVERLRRALNDNEATQVWGGVACYPAHAMSADELLTQADEALTRAREWPQDRIEVAFAE